MFAQGKQACGRDEHGWFSLRRKEKTPESTPPPLTDAATSTLTLPPTPDPILHLNLNGGRGGRELRPQQGRTLRGGSAGASISKAVPDAEQPSRQEKGEDPAAW